MAFAVKVSVRQLHLCSMPVKINFTVHTARQRDVSSFLRPNFAIMNFGVYPKWMCQRQATPSLSTVKIGIFC